MGGHRGVSAYLVFVHESDQLGFGEMLRRFCDSGLDFHCRDGILFALFELVSDQSVFADEPGHDPLVAQRLHERARELKSVVLLVVLTLSDKNHSLFLVLQIGADTGQEMLDNILVEFVLIGGESELGRSLVGGRDWRMVSMVGALSRLGDALLLQHQSVVRDRVIIVLFLLVLLQSLNHRAELESLRVASRLSSRVSDKSLQVQLFRHVHRLLRSHEQIAAAHLQHLNSVQSFRSRNERLFGAHRRNHHFSFAFDLVLNALRLRVIVLQCMVILQRDHLVCLVAYFRNQFVIGLGLETIYFRVSVNNEAESGSLARTISDELVL